MPGVVRAVYDLQMGRNAGSLTIGVAWGNHSRDELAVADPWLIVDEPWEILRALGIEEPGGKEGTG